MSQDRVEYTTGPRRIQRKRTKGWTMPAGAIYVGRGSKWGNPWSVETMMEAGMDEKAARRAVVFAFSDALLSGAKWPMACTLEEVRTELRNRDLACWCSEDRPCHADVLLEIANG